MIDSSTRPDKLSNAALFFLVLAPLVVVNYGLYVFNPENISSPIVYGFQVLADFFSILTVSGLWLTILVDLLTPAHQFTDRSTRRRWLLANTPTADIFIPTAGEPPALVAKTIAAAVAISYPHKTIVLDDGRSDAIKKLAAQYGAEYVRRDHNRNAKSGNINNGLAKSQAEFFAVLDADFIAEPSFLEELLSYMQDKTIAFVQSPQAYTNLQHFIAKGTAAAQDIFYKYVLPSRNSSESAFCVGTNVVFRRKAVDEIGGIFELDHSEDIWTSLVLHEKGWRSLFVNKVLARGLAPDNMISYFKQQKRWAQGGFSIFFKKNPLFIAGLSFDQRMQYLFTSMFYFVGFSILTYLLLPIIYLMTGASPIHAQSSIQWVWHYLPFFVLFYSIPILLNGKISVPLVSTALATFAPFIQAFFSTIFGQRYTWVTTASNKFTIKDQVSLYLWPHLMLISLSVSSVLVAWVVVRDPTNTAINSFWALVNAYLLGVFVRRSFVPETEEEEPVLVITPKRTTKKSTPSPQEEQPLDHHLI